MSRPCEIAPEAFFKLDAILVENGVCALAGWISGRLEPHVDANGAMPMILASGRHSRPDVSRHLGTGPEERHGFSLAFAMPRKGGCWLSLRNGEREAARFGLDGFNDMPQALDESIFGPDVAALVRRKRLAPKARGALDCAIRWPDPACGMPVIGSGWLAAAKGARILVGNGSGELFEPRISYCNRPDIAFAYDVFPDNGRPRGMVFSLCELPPESGEIALYAAWPDRTEEIARTAITDCWGYRNYITDCWGYRNYIKEIFGIEIWTMDLTGAYGDVFMPVLGQIQESRARAIAGVASCRRDYGRPCASEVAVIVPVYGNFDFIGRQMAAFPAARSFQEKARLVYVIADPRLLESFLELAGGLCRQYGLSCSVVWQNAPLGYGEACNLGAREAPGEYLVFMNSDV